LREDALDARVDVFLLRVRRDGEKEGRDDEESPHGESLSQPDPPCASNTPVERLNHNASPPVVCCD